jgi:hypothetical protein
MHRPHSRILPPQQDHSLIKTIGPLAESDSTDYDDWAEYTDFADARNHSLALEGAQPNSAADDGIMLGAGSKTASFGEGIE